ncbi:TadE/TadG family type IV pilus assembly protein [Streptomyces sp. NPDC056485]|uniref:TadE/TadG family type IV pilus assembly protein n=1 Tax=Streptomyces sp. NPDC056485 TaxID=3345834 RepID=UPI003696609A
MARTERRRPARNRRTGGWPAALRRRVTGGQGEASIQMAIIFPVVILVTVAVVQAAMWVHARSIALTAAREGVAAARVYQAPDSAGAARARETLDRIAGDSLITTAVSTSASSAADVRVTVTGRAPSLIPGVGGLSVSQSAGAPRERWTTP